MASIWIVSGPLYCAIPRDYLSDTPHCALLSGPNRSDFEITNRWRLQSQLKTSLRLREHPLKPTLWTRDLPVLPGFCSVSEASHRSGNPQEIVATTRVCFRITAIFLAQCDVCVCDTTILLRFLQEKLATSKL